MVTEGKRENTLNPQYILHFVDFHPDLLDDFSYHTVHDLVNPVHPIWG